MALCHTRLKMLSRRRGNVVRMLAYRAGTSLVCKQTGERFNYQRKDVQAVELLLPPNAPEWAHDLQILVAQDRQRGVQALSDLAESYEKRKDSQVYREYEFALPRELTDAQCQDLAREFVQDQLCGRGMTALLNFHMDMDTKTGLRKPHCHAVMLTRSLTATGLALHKETAWNNREFGKIFREQWADYTNFHLAKHGFDRRVDPRTYREQGLDLEPQPKLGKAVMQQEQKMKQADHSHNLTHNIKVHDSTVTDKAAAFQKVKLGNLYRLLKDPEAVLQWVTKHQVTFMWGDVEAVLARYIDDPLLYQQVNAKLQASKELIMLREQGASNDKIGDKNPIQPVYTTRAMLQTEYHLVELAEKLSTRQSHCVKERVIDKTIKRWDKILAQHGGLSADQKAALRHMAREDQLSYVVGYAGAGKTTVLEAAQEMWQASGYQVYGLAPTGRAAQNLTACGIEAQTVDKFLKDYHEGRNLLSSNSILVLDEAGMVDVGRSEQLLSAVQKLGVKLVAVGDGAQLQAVAGGAAFRLITERIQHAKLETIIRQQHDWQREATQLFGQLKTADAIGCYQERGCIELIDEPMPDNQALVQTQDYRGLVEAYNISRRIAGIVYHDMQEDLKAEPLKAKPIQPLLKDHPDYELWSHWKHQRQDCAEVIRSHLDSCRPYLQELGVDPISFATNFVTPKYQGQQRLDEARNMAQAWQLPQLLPETKPHQCDLRQNTRSTLITAWQQSMDQHPKESYIMLTYTNADTAALNHEARHLMKQRGRIYGREHTFTIQQDHDNDFGDRVTSHKQKNFALGDRLVFLCNDNRVGVKNGQLGTIVGITGHSVNVQVDGIKGDEGLISYDPTLYPYFDHGWATTIHKAQGVTVDRSFVLATHETYRNLAYVAMTRHREHVTVFGSKLEFWRDEKVPQVMGRLNEKLSAFDYDVSAALKAMQKDSPLQQAWDALGNHMKALKVVPLEGWQRVSERFTGQGRAPFMPKIAEALSEQARSRDLFEQPTSALMDSLEQTKPNQEKSHVNDLKPRAQYSRPDGQTYKPPAQDHAAQKNVKHQEEYDYGR